MEKKFYLPDYDFELTIGKFAGQADGAAWLKQGGTIVLATAVSSPTEDFPGFLPLTIDYRELFSAVGRIPGGYFKREGKFTDKEVLQGRLIDRAIRPLFPTQYFDAIQILATVYSHDKKHMAHTLALIATSLALTLSKIPFMEPVGAVELGRVGGTWIVNPNFEETLASDVKIVVAGTHDGIVMVEGTSKELSESQFVDALFMAHEHIKKQVAWQRDIQRELNVEKAPVNDPYDWHYWTNKVEHYLTDEQVQNLFITDKVRRSEAMNTLKEGFLGSTNEEALEKNLPASFLPYLFEKVLQEKLTQQMFKLNKRIDNRDFNTVRPIVAEVGLLPFAHGSALFKRGRTQALVSATLGGGQDEVRTEDLLGDATERNFMLHYNFPPFSVGEVRSQRGPGRREVGHGYLAQSAIKQVLPHKDEFPYTIRIVADILESDGSTSMATVCGGILSLMDAGVPITGIVSGIAMGLLQNEKGEFQVLTDIAGIEDAFGLMDFKVAGTDSGITAIQMDIKHKGGLPREVFEQALSQARHARLHILQEMRKALSAPRSQLSDLVPQIVSFKIPTDKIGSIIGSRGSTIRDIIDKTDTSIDIDDDGTVKIFGAPGAHMELAVKWIKALAGQIEPGDTFKGHVKRIADFGIFVEIAPGQDGLVHISTIPRAQQPTLAKDFKPEDEVLVEVIDYDKATERIRLKFITSDKSTNKH